MYITRRLNKIQRFQDNFESILYDQLNNYRNSSSANKLINVPYWSKAEFRQERADLSNLPAYLIDIQELDELDKYGGIRLFNKVRASIDVFVQKSIGNTYASQYFNHFSAVLADLFARRKQELGVIRWEIQQSGGSVENDNVLRKQYVYELRLA